MRRLFLVMAAFCLTCFTIYAQTPQMFNYQGVACDNTGAELANQEVGLKFTILQENPTGLPVYLEEHIVQTDEFGLFALNIGEGGVSATGDFSAIDWSNGTYFLKVEMDVNQSGSFQTLATTQLISVPYALFAERAALADSALFTERATLADSALNDQDPDPLNEIQELSFQNGTLSISGANSIAINDDDADPTNELQDILFDGSNIILRDPDGNERSISLYDGIFTRPGANFDFPQGIVGEYVTIDQQSYTVPAGQVFYVTSGERFIELPALSEEAYTAPNMPVFTPGTLLRNCNCSGFLVPDDNEIEEVVLNFSSLNAFVVPSGKTLVLKSGFDGFENVELVVNGRTTRYERPNGIKITKALIFTEGTQIELMTPDNGLIYTGYYIDN